MRALAVAAITMIFWYGGFCREGEFQVWTLDGEPEIRMCEDEPLFDLGE